MTPKHSRNRLQHGGVATSLLFLLNILTLGIAVLGLWGLNERFEAKLVDQQEEFDRRLAEVESPPSSLTRTDIEPIVQSLLDNFWPEQLEGLNDQFGSIQEMLAPLESFTSQMELFARFNDQLDALKLGQVAQDAWFKTQFDEIGDLQGQLFDLQDVIQALPLNMDTSPSTPDASDVDQLRELLERLEIALPAAVESQNADGGTTLPPVDISLPEDDSEPASTSTTTDAEQLETLIRILQRATESTPADSDSE
jgi:hypothetical protein